MCFELRKLHARTQVPQPDFGLQKQAGTERDVSMLRMDVMFGLSEYR